MKKSSSEGKLINRFPILNKIKLVIGCCLILTVALALCGCGKSDGDDAGSNTNNAINSFADLKDRSAVIGILTEFDLDAELSEICPNYEPVLYDDLLIAIEALQSGKYDAITCGEYYLTNAMDSGNVTDVKILEEPVKTYYCALGLSDEAPVDDYVNRVNASIEQLIEDGTIEDMKDRWYYGQVYDMPEIEMPEEPEYTLRVVTFGQSKPYSFLRNNELVGFDIELAYRVAALLNCDVELTRAEYPSMLMGLAAGKYDMISSNLYITEERGNSITYSTSFDESKICMMVRDDEKDSGISKAFDDFVQGFRRTFIEENRWKMVLEGFLVTILITVLGFALANILGILFCSLSMSKSSLLRAIEDIYVRIMQGTPIVVILLILFYIIFGRSKISGMWVAVIGFGMTSGASLSRQFKGAISSVSREQKEAALALGLNRFEAFTGIVMPQAIRSLLSGYFSEIIGLFKGTSIVGYVAVIDLTKASDLIRSATYDAFFPLISVAVIYFLISFLLLSILKSIQKKLEHRPDVGCEDTASIKPVC